MDAVPRPGRVAEAALLAGVGIVLAWAVLFGHGSRDGTLATAGIVAIACAAAGIALGLRGTVPLPRLDRAGTTTFAAVAALTAWAGVSIAWSIAGDLSWAWLTPATRKMARQSMTRPGRPAKKRFTRPPLR